MSSSNFGGTLLGEATHQAVDSLADQLGNSANAIPTRKIELSGVVADVSGDTLVLNLGGKSGVKVGDVLEVSRPLRSIKDPTTGKVIKVITQKVGTATVTEVDDQSSTATFKGAAPVRIGDKATNQEQ